MFLIGLANSLVDINAYTIVQRLAPAEVMGRVFGALGERAHARHGARRAADAAADRHVGLRAGLAVIGGVVAVLGARRAGGAAPDRHHRARAARARRCCAGCRRSRYCRRRCIERLAQSLVSMTVPPATAVIREGDAGDRFWVIERGRPRSASRRAHPRPRPGRLVRRDRPAARRPADGDRARRRRRGWCSRARPRRLHRRR